MLAGRVYRKLLLIYPKEHRREYGEPMVQLFRDRMRQTLELEADHRRHADGDGFRGGGGVIIWFQMIFDLGPVHANTPYYVVNIPIVQQKMRLHRQLGEGPSHLHSP